MAAIIYFLVYIMGLTHLVNGVEVKIIGGTEAVEGEFPYMVDVQFRTPTPEKIIHLCGGTIIDSTHILTLASCVQFVSADSILVTAGSLKLSDALKGLKQRKEVKNIVRHPDYKGDTGNDLAILELTQALNLTGNISTLKMASKRQESSGQCLIAGWGVTKSGSANISEVLMKGEISINPKQDCVNAYPQFVVEKEICAGNMGSSQVDTCLGDLGAPLVCKSNEEEYLAGISSWGGGCGTKYKPGVYMEVAKYREWIDRVIYSLPETTTGNPATVTPSTQDAISEDVQHTMPKCKNYRKQYQVRQLKSSY